ncbi:glycosyltransferase [Evansella tamaricis]|uniref:Glycosyltransferase family 2 protein n=1 Tax=Evansella tamaricis TaxID=2069301 RepID=A0ABS6JI13_9BACI|nr:glycosyltransferase family A protein [Evansella tamaricis]MBU9713305.1 glycosyltransferase family 2 protein [Evansella tamaricis]
MVSIITCTMRQHYMMEVFENYHRQNWEKKELIIILNSDTMDIRLWKERAEEYENVSIFHQPERISLWECINFGVERAKFDYIFKFDDDDYYSPFYIQEQMECFKEQQADIVGKKASYCYLERDNALLVRHWEHEDKFVDHIFGATIGMKKSVFSSVKFPDRNVGGDRLFLRRCHSKNMKIYASSRRNYMCVRTNDPNHHTWKSDEEQFYRKGDLIAYTDNPRKLIP